MNAAPLARGATSSAEGVASPWYRRLYAVVLAGIILGALLGYCFPDVGERMKPLGDLFIRLIRMMIEPIVFTTVVVGVGSMGNVREVGRVGLKALITLIQSGLFQVASASKKTVSRKGRNLRLG